MSLQGLTDSRCPAGAHVIVGTDGPDVLVGTNGADCILGLGGDDRIDGRNGRDVLIGGGGNDILRGDQQTDTLYGDDGDDELWGGVQDDTLYGGAGDDRLYGENGEDLIHGDGGRDVIDGGNGRDTLHGDDDCDRIDARNGPDRVFGGAGNDVINAGSAPDRVEGGDGDDVIACERSSSVDGGPGIDECRGAHCEGSPPQPCSDDRGRGGGGRGHGHGGYDDSCGCGDGRTCDLVTLLCVPEDHCPVVVSCTGDGGSLDGGLSTCDDLNPCTFDTCTSAGCTHVPAPDGASCSDGDPCNGAETCADRSCNSGAPPELDDGDECTDDVCDPVEGVQHLPRAPDGVPDVTCDEVDDDCDGNLDEDFVSEPTTCGVGACAATGVTSCSAGAVDDSCAVGTGNGPDTACNGFDDDCDGNTDEAYSASATSCGVGACSASGTTSCVAGFVADSCTAGSASGTDAICDGSDEDCDGATDEGYAAVPTSCGIGACAASGTTSCAAGAVLDSCAVASPTGADTDCDGVDDDCDGSMDEGYASIATTCGVGACVASGATSCVGGSVVDSCTAASPSGTDALCDGLDDDCDRSTDESYVPLSTSCGTGVCSASGSTSCNSGSIVDSCAKGSPTGPDVLCDGFDEDCDGSTDEGYASVATSCGTGECSATGSTACTGGSVVDSCVETSPAGPDALCDGLDEDCDGTSDEGYVPLSTSCGTGVCSASGATSCTSGSVVDSCVAASPTGPDSSCDRLDDDCDGSTDESYAVIATSCGTGVCAASGATSCMGGTVVNSCVPASATGTDARCDGVDDDCDGTTDESYAVIATSCGTGVCAATGSTSCASGVVVDSCSAASPTGTDTLCDGLDDDCDGSTDESYAVIATSCGTGVCSASGMTSCTAGAVVDGCSPGAATGADVSCDGVDQDCDGTVDEAYGPVATACGVGVCASSGATYCVAGAVLDSCSGGGPTGVDAVCDGVDEDCDGMVDEAYVEDCAGSSVLRCFGGALLEEPCSNANACDGEETCTAGVCADGVPPPLDDGDPCTADACDPVGGVSHPPAPDGTACPDAFACNGAEACASGVCVAGTVPAVDDENPCTADACNEPGGVEHTPVADGTSCADLDPCNGEEFCYQGACYPGDLPTAGPCTPPGPTAGIFVDEQRDVLTELAGASIVSYTGPSSPAPTLNGGGLSWSPQFQATGPEVVLALGGARAAVLDALTIQTDTSAAFVRTLEVSASETTSDPAAFTSSQTLHVPPCVVGTPCSRVEIPLVPVSARYVRIRVVDNQFGQPGRGNFYPLGLRTRTREGGALNVFQAGVPISASSNPTIARNAIDTDPFSAWSSTSGTVHTLTMDLLGTEWNDVDRVRFWSPATGSTFLRDFEVWVSRTGTATDDFERAAILALNQASSVPGAGAYVHLFFEPTTARYVQVRTLTAQGTTALVAIPEVQFLTAHVGGLTVPFQDVTVPGAAPVVQWRWDFGDGYVDTARHPTHTFAAPGRYIVLLETIDANGISSSAEYDYLAQPDPEAFFDWSPEQPAEGQTVTFTDRSTSDTPIIRWEWQLGSTAHGTNAPGASTSIAFTTPGTVRASLTVTDAWLRTDTYERTLEVANLPPRISVGSDQTVRWDEGWIPDETVLMAHAASVSYAALSCEWDFDDGTVVGPQPCRTGGRIDYQIPEHVWAIPGDYEVVVTIRDLDGGAAQDRFFVEVVAHDTALSIAPVADELLGGAHTVTATLVDLFGSNESMAGRTVRLERLGVFVDAVTDASGRASAELDFGTGGPAVLHAAFAGDDYYNPSSAAESLPITASAPLYGNCGTEFWLAFHDGCQNLLEYNCTYPEYLPYTHDVVIASERPVVVSYESPGLGLRGGVAVPADGVARLSFDQANDWRDERLGVPGSGTRSTRTLHLTSPTEICVAGVSQQRFTTDGFLAIPVHNLGTDYVVASYPPASVGGSTPSLFTVLATEANTTVTVRSPVPLRDGPDTPGTSFLPANVPFDVTLQAGEAMAFQAASSGGDVTGAVVTSSAPVAVFGGLQIAFVPPTTQAGDYLIEQLPPTNRLGTRFFATPFAERTSGYVLRVVAAHDGTVVTVDGVEVITLARGGRWELNELEQVSHEIVTSTGAIAYVLAKGQNSDGAVGDPFMSLLVPVEQFGSRAFSSTPFDREDDVIQYSNWLGIVVATTDVGGLRVDGTAVAEPFVAIGTSGFAYSNVAVGSGPHRVSHLNPSTTFSVQAYGWNVFESYGYPGYMRLRPETACSPTPMVAGDGVDNECDGRIDEELANGLDDDGDGLVDEDLVADAGEPVNVAPFAYDRRIGVREDESVGLVLAGFDPNGDTLTFEVLTSPAHGTLAGAGAVHTYTPQPDYAGDDPFTYRACDATLCSPPATYTVAVRGVNDPPDVQMAPTVVFIEDTLATLPCIATDVDGDPDCPITWSIVVGPLGMEIDAVRGILYWVPPESMTNSIVPVTVRATDCRGAGRDFTFGIEVGNQSDPPVITSAPVRFATIGRGYSYDVDARDPDPGDTVQFEVIEAPAFLSLNPVTGILSGVPAASDVGTHRVSVVAVDSIGLRSDPQEYVLDVAGDNTPPSVVVAVSPPLVLVGETATIQVTLSDDAGAVLDELTVAGVPVAFDATGRATFSSPTPGVLDVVATAHDGSGNVATGATVVRVRVEGDDVAPVVDLAEPLEDATLTYLHEAVGTVTDANLYRWTLDLRRTDRRGDWVTIAEGRTPVTEATLTTIDTTLLENGYYVLRLRGEDVNGAIGEESVRVRVDGGAKVGIVQLRFVDMVSRNFGFPLAVVRTYGSRRANVVGDFGNGWDLEVRAGSVRSNRPIGADHVIYTSVVPLQVIPDPCNRVVEHEAHFTEVRLSDEEWYLFRPVVTDIEPISGGCVGRVSFEFVDGTNPGARLGIVGDDMIRSSSVTTLFVSPPPPGNLRYFDGSIFDPQQFDLSLDDGRSIRLSTTRGVEIVSDAHGNAVDFTDPLGIRSSGGGSFGFVRDRSGRITRVTDPSGREVHYTYDAAGNLVQFTDALARATRYEYRAPTLPHHLTDIVDSRGVRSAALGYGTDGRLREVCDPEGVCITAEYDLAGASMRHIDGVGRPTIYNYDLAGNVVTERDGLGNTTEYFHSPPNNSAARLVGTLNPLGHRESTRYATFTREVVGRSPFMEMGEHPTPFETTYTYAPADAPSRIRDRPLTETLPTGGTHHFEYNAAGDRTRTTDDAGRVVSEETFDATGNVLTYTDRFGTVRYEYADPSGHPTRVTHADGSVTSLAYDGRGHLRSAQRGTLTMSFVHDTAGRMLLADYGRGITVRYTYDGDRDEWTTIEGSSFGRVTRRFSAGRRLVAWSLPNGDSYTRTYDAAGRVRQESGPDGTTRYSYDDAGRLERSEDVARGAVTTYERDDAGRVIATIDPLGRRTESDLDARGTARVRTDARGETWTATDVPTSSTSTDPLGNTTTSLRGPYGLPTSTVFPGGASTSVAFFGDTAIDGSGDYPVTRTDELGRVRRSGYSAFDAPNPGELSGTTELGGILEWAYAYQNVAGASVRWDLESGRVWLEPEQAEPEVGTYRARNDERDAHRPAELDFFGRALREITSPLGEVTRYSRNEYGRLDRIELPFGGLETRAYDGRGWETSRILPSGVTFTYVRDAAGRVTSRTGSDGSSIARTFGAGDRTQTLTDASGVTDYEYDAAGRWTGLVAPSGATWSRTHDVLDRVTSVSVEASATSPARTTTYEHDEAGNITRIVDPLGGITEQTFDALGRLETRTLPNGVTSTWTYDARGWTDTVVHRAADGDVIASVDYTRTASGEPERIDREDGSYVLYEYDSALRLSGEFHRDAGGGIVRNLRYVYDADGNRTQRIVQEGPGAPSVVEDYAYSAGDLLETVSVEGVTTVDYDYDTAGRVTTISNGAERTLGWDADDHVTSITEGPRTVHWTFDGDGRRVSRTEEAFGLTDREVGYAIAPTRAESLESPHAVTDGAGNETVGYVYAGEHPLFRYDPVTGEPVYYLQDGMGSVIGLVGDDVASERSTIHYDGFGNERSTTGALAHLPAASAGDFRFQGMWLDQGTGLYYVRARVYEAGTGRFLSRDPAEGHRTGPETYWAYAFAGSAPTTASDPTGLFTLAEINVSISVHSVLLALAQSYVTVCSAVLLASAAGGGLGGTGQCGSGGGRRRSTCSDPEFRGLRRCSAYEAPPIAYEFRSPQSTLNAMKAALGIPSLRFGTNAPTTSGPCVGEGRHINVYDRSAYVGSVVSCPCCEEGSSGARRAERCGAL